MNIPDILIPEFISIIEGLAPHSYPSTKKALSFIPGLEKMKKIADIGCGQGYQSIILLERTKSQIIAIDHRIDFIQSFRRELKNQKLNIKITPILSEFDNLPFLEEELDLIWSEFATSEVDFNWALDNWAKYLKMGGYIGICAYCWLNNNPPEEVLDFFLRNKININFISNRIEKMEKIGFIPISHFIMAEECWWNYFIPFDTAINVSNLLEKYSQNSDVVQFVKDVNTEIALYEKYGDYYGYVFFIGEKHRY